MSEYLESQGVQIKIGDGASPEVFTKIAQVTDFSGPGGNAKIIDVTNLDSTAIEKLMGLMDEGQVKLGIILSPADTNGQMAARAARSTRAKKNFEIVLTDDSPATTLSFEAFVPGFEIAGAVDDAIKGTITLEVTGPVTWS